MGLGSLHFVIMISHRFRLKDKGSRNQIARASALLAGNAGVPVAKRRTNEYTRFTRHKIYSRSSVLFKHEVLSDIAVTVKVWEGCTPPQSLRGFHPHGTWPCTAASARRAPACGARCSTLAGGGELRLRRC
jgi:hypothetical protein